MAVKKLKTRSKNFTVEPHSLNGKFENSLVIIHGGVGRRELKDPSFREIGELLQNIVGGLSFKKSAVDIVVDALGKLELSPVLNAGLGGVLQSDGQVRLSAALMDGSTQKFSSVSCATHLTQPSLLLKELQTMSSRNLVSPGIELLSMKLGLKPSLAATDEQIAHWVKHKTPEVWDTVGAVVFNQGKLAAGTSTGGVAMAFPGRVSDSSTVAGNYSSDFVAVSCTGVGEEIIDDAVAARIETRCRDGKDLQTACKQTLAEAVALKRRYGWIAVDKNGFWNISYTTPTITYALASNKKILGSSLDLLRN